MNPAQQAKRLTNTPHPLPNNQMECQKLHVEKQYTVILTVQDLG